MSVLNPTPAVLPSIWELRHCQEQSFVEFAADGRFEPRYDIPTPMLYLSNFVASNMLVSILHLYRLIRILHRRESARVELKSKLLDQARLLASEMCIIPSPTLAQAVASTGVDLIIIDREHAATNNETLHAMIMATQGTDSAAMVRVIDHNPANVKLALDMGAEGIMFPLVRTADEAAACVASMRYPPKGIRGWGAFVAHSRWGVPPMDYLPTFGDKTVCCLLIETSEAVRNIDAIFAVDGVDMAFVAPFDLSTSLGVSGQFDHPDYREAVGEIEAAAMAAKIPLGGGPANTEAEVDTLCSRGCRAFGGFDVFQIKRAVGELVEFVKARSRVT
jgi:4-hydroxy-2-oxoheptanedioate aldolase